MHPHTNVHGIFHESQVTGGVNQNALKAQVSDLLGSPHVLGLRAMTQKMPREFFSWKMVGFTFHKFI